MRVTKSSDATKRNDLTVQLIYATDAKINLSLRVTMKSNGCHNVKDSWENEVSGNLETSSLIAARRQYAWNIHELEAGVQRHICPIGSEPT